MNFFAYLTHTGARRFSMFFQHLRNHRRFFFFGRRERKKCEERENKAGAWRLILFLSLFVIVWSAIAIKTTKQALARKVFTFLRVNYSLIVVVLYVCVCVCRCVVRTCNSSACELQIGATPFVFVSTNRFMPLFVLFLFFTLTRFYFRLIKINYYFPISFFFFCCLCLHRKGTFNELVHTWQLRGHRRRGDWTNLKIAFAKNKGCHLFTFALRYRAQFWHIRSPGVAKHVFTQFFVLFAWQVHIPSG